MIYPSIISSLVRSPSGGSTTTSQCSKSHPSSKIVSLGGLFDQLGFGSFREDEVACVERPLKDTNPPRATEDKAATRGRDRSAEREDAGVLARGADDEAKDRANREERDFAGRRRKEREMVCVAMGNPKENGGRKR